MAFSDDLIAGLNAAPELHQSPDLALSAAQSGDAIGNAQVLAHTANTYAADKGYNAVAKHIHFGALPAALGWFGGTLHDSFHALGTGAGFALHLLGKPLQEVQHEYRYLHDVESRHGPGAALLEGLGIAAGATAGAFIGGGTGAALGGELAGELLGHLTYQDSFHRTRPGVKYVDPSTQQPVSIGRDVGHLLGLKPGSKPFTAISGVGDAVADLTLDPVALASGAVHELRAAQISVRTVADLERVAQNVPRVSNAIDHMATLSAGEIATRYKGFAGLEHELGAASTRREVLDVLGDNLKIEEITDKSPYRMPTYTPTRRAIQAAQAAVGGIEGKGVITSRIESAVRRQTLLPTYLDPATLKLSAAEFDMADPKNSQTIYRSLRMFYNRRVSEGILTNIVNEPEVGSKLTVLKQSWLDGLLKMGIPDDAEVLRNLKGEIDELGSGVKLGSAAEYGYDMSGRSLSEFQTRQFNTIKAGILENQVGNVSLPDFQAVQSLRRSLNSGTALFGKVDDFFYSHFTYPVFKRFALLTGGFAERIAAAELIPNMLRLGPLNVVKGRLASSAAEYQDYVKGVRTWANTATDLLGHERMSEDEIKNLIPAVQRARGWATNLLADPERTKFALARMAVSDGHLVSPAINAEHVHSPTIMDTPQRLERTIYKTAQKAPAWMRTTDEFGSFAATDVGQSEAWHAAVAEMRRSPSANAGAKAYLEAMQRGESIENATAHAQRAVKDVLDAMGDGGNYIRSTEGSHDDWAATITEAMKGVSHSALRETGEGGVPHLELLRAIANPEENALPRLDWFQNVDDSMRPAAIKGRMLQPVAPAGLTEKVANAGYQRVLTPMINWLSREPIYDAQAWKEFQPFLKAIDDGTMKYADAVHLAQQRATQNMLPFIHNTMERTQFAEASRNFMPFWFAQQQAFKRYGRLLAEDPAAFRRLQLMSSALTEVGHHAQDKQGGNWFNYPGSGFLGLGVPKLLNGLGIPMTSAVPVSFAGDLQSFNTIFPGSEGGRPGLGPLVTIPLHLMESFMPESRPVVKEIIGPQSDSQALWKQLVPNSTLQRTVEAFAGQHSRAFQNAMMNTVQQMEYLQAQHPERNIVPGADAGPLEQQQFIDRIKNQTRVNFLLRAVIGAVSPASPQFKIGDLGLRQEVRSQVKKLGLIEGTQQFLHDHPDATAYTVFQSKANAAGAPLSATADAESFYNANRTTLDRYPYAGAWLIPQSKEKFNSAVYNEQLAQGLRIHKAPDQFLEDLYTAAGNRQYFDVDLPAKNRAIADANGDKTKIAAINADFSHYLQNTLRLQNPVWYDNFTSEKSATNRMKAIQQLDEMFARNLAPAGSHSDDIRSLLNDYHSFVANLPQGQDSVSTGRRKFAKADFAAYLKTLADAKPNLAPLITKVFALEVNNPFVDQQAVA